jgi:copper(I)-binding protein
MMNRRMFLTTAAATCLAFALPSFAEDMAQDAGVQATDAYAISSGAIGKTGAIFLMLHNSDSADDRLVDARADVAQRVELHTHKDDGNGVMQMIHLTEGMPLAGGSMHELARGGDHVMLMGLTRELKDGDTFPLTLVFENAPEMVVEVTVDNAHKPAAPATGAMEGMDH